MSVKENWLFLGNPGVGKSTLLNCLIGRQAFESGVSYSEGLTKHYERVVVNGIAYMDTPGLADVRIIERAAHEITVALKQSGTYKLFFLVRLQSGRLVEEDIGTIERVLDAVQVNNIKFTIVINNLKKKAFDTMTERGKEYHAVMSLINSRKYKTSAICLIPHLSELEEAPGGVTRLPSHVYKFMREEAPAMVIPERQVDEVNRSGWQQQVESLREEIAAFQREIQNMWRRIDEFSRHRKDDRFTDMKDTEFTDYVSLSPKATDGYEFGSDPDGALREGSCPRPFSREVVGLLVHYAAVGIMLSILTRAVSQHLDWEASSVPFLHWLPFACRVIWAIFSDCVPLFGYRRRPYILIGWGICLVMTLGAGIVGRNDPYAYGEASNRRREQLNGAGKSLVAVTTMATIGYSLAHVSAEGLLVEIAQREPNGLRGRIQSVCFAIQCAASGIGGLLMDLVYDGARRRDGGALDVSVSFSTVMIILAIALVPILPITWRFLQEQNGAVSNIRNHFPQLWRRLQTRAVDQVILFTIFSNVLANIYPVHGTHFDVFRDAFRTTSIIRAFVGECFTTGGVAMVALFGLNWHWRQTIAIATIAIVVLDALGTFVTVWVPIDGSWLWKTVHAATFGPRGVLSIVPMFVFVELAGEGCEATMFGLFIGLMNLSETLAWTLSRTIEHNWDFTSTENASSSDVSLAALVTYACWLASLLFLVLLPSQKRATQKLIRAGKSNRTLVFITVFAIFFLAVWTIMVKILAIFPSTSCLRIAGGEGC